MIDSKSDQIPLESAQDDQDSGYQVLARKYRPMDFSELIGQDAMIRTLTNAFETGRLAHAFILTGVRGVGKTTTARIIAKALNCIDKEEPTINPCGKCEMCTAISEDRHLDVYEMDAASRTGVDDIRELIEGVRYKPVSSRYKVYIIDEVHMLSRNAFNALLKTLEEPPKHVKFIFATTEIRKVPVTVLSRCQRFDLRRVNIVTLSNHFAEIVNKENAKISEQRLSLIARVSDGSVRDGQSLLDQIITTSCQEDRMIEEEDVREILGLADREKTFELLEQIFRGDIGDALETVQQDYTNGLAPLSILQDLLDLVHLLTRTKVTPDVLEALSTSETERVRSRDLTETLSMASLGRAWQMMLKGLNEIQISPAPIQALEMILVRLCYLSNLPSPEEVIETFQTNDSSAAQPTVSGVRNGQQKLSTDSLNDVGASPPRENPTVTGVKFESFEQIIAALDDNDERILRADLINNVHLIRFEPGKIVIRLAEGGNTDTPNRLSKFLNSFSDVRWSVLTADEEGIPTFKEQKDQEQSSLRSEVMQSQLMQSVLENFPGAQIENVRQLDDRPLDLPNIDLTEGEENK